MLLEWTFNLLLYAILLVHVSQRGHSNIHEVQTWYDVLSTVRTIFDINSAKKCESIIKKNQRQD